MITFIIIIGYIMIATIYYNFLIIFYPGFKDDFLLAIIVVFWVVTMPALIAYLIAVTFIIKPINKYSNKYILMLKEKLKWKK